jgi:hypothetical protein
MRSEGGRRPTLAGLPIFAGLARHWASSHASPNLPPLGMRVRLKASVEISTYPADVQVILTALKKYGMILADNAGGFFCQRSTRSPLERSKHRYHEADQGV